MKIETLSIEKATKIANEKVARNMIDTLGLDAVLYGVIHKMICDCIENEMPSEDRREEILTRINYEISKVNGYRW